MAERLQSRASKRSLGGVRRTINSDLSLDLSKPTGSTPFILPTTSHEDARYAEMARAKHRDHMGAVPSFGTFSGPSSDLGCLDGARI